MTHIWDIKTIGTAALELRMLPGIGGRLWDILFGGRSVLFQNPDLIGLPFDLDRLGTLPTRSPHFGFPLWGGEKTWIAPDRDWPGGAPYKALDSGRYRVLEHTATRIRMTSEVCPDSGFRVSRGVEVLSGTEFAITHDLENTARDTRRAGVWSVMMLNHPAVIGVPVERAEVRPVFGAAGDMVRAGDGRVLAHCDAPREFKVALPNDHGVVLIRSAAQGLWLACRTAPPQASDQFAHGLPFEVFNSGDYPYCEAEWHSPLRSLATGDTLTFRQAFSVLPEDEIEKSENLPAFAGDIIAEMKQCMS